MLLVHRDAVSVVFREEGLQLKDLPRRGRDSEEIGGKNRTGDDGIRTV